MTRKPLLQSETGLHRVSESFVRHQVYHRNSSDDPRDEGDDEAVGLLARRYGGEASFYLSNSFASRMNQSTKGNYLRYLPLSNRRTGEYLL